MPLALAQPKAALVGLPFASNAALIAGPFTSISLSACLSARSVMNRASLLGVAYHFELEKESIEHFLWLQKNYKKVEVHLYSGELAQKENWWCLKGTKYNCFSTLEIYEDYAIEEHINKDGTITQYTYWK